MAANLQPFYICSEDYILDFLMNKAVGRLIIAPMKRFIMKNCRAMSVGRIARSILTACESSLSVIP